MTEVQITAVAVVGMFATIGGVAYALSCRSLRKKDRADVLRQLISSVVVLSVTAMGGATLAPALLEVVHLPQDRGG